MDDLHRRRIELQSPADFTYLLTNIRASAQQKIDAAYPNSAAPQQGEDALKSKVEELVQAYVAKTLELAIQSISINGQDASHSLLQPVDPDQDPPSPTSPAADDSTYEPHDPRLAEKLRMLYMQHEQETTRVAEMRRDAPGAAARAYIERLNKEIETEREMEVEEGGRASVAGLGALDRKEGNRKNMGKKSRRLAGLENIEQIAARLERAGRAAEIVDNM